MYRLWDGETLSDETYMRLAIELASTTLGQTGVNPAVGCVVVKDGRVVGVGAHLARGGPHAEVHALQMAGPDAAGSTVYVTLEPCTHYGRTPPCCDRLIAEGVKRVVVGCLDPNPAVAGRGVEKLRAHGVEVEVGLLGGEAEKLIEMFRKYITTRMPFVTMKAAATLDGKIASKSGDSRWITGERARAFVHTLRHRHQAVMVGVDTVLADDPLLTTRLAIPALSPVRLVVDSRLRLPPDARVVKEGGARTIVLTTRQASIERAMRLNAAGAEVLRCGDGPLVDLREAMRLLGEREIGSVLLEGGGRLNGAMLDARLVDKVVLFYGPILVGGGERAPDVVRNEGADRIRDAIRLRDIEVTVFGEDVCVVGYPVYPEADVEETGTAGGPADSAPRGSIGRR